jgi:hypothetical protein
MMHYLLCCTAILLQLAFLPAAATESIVLDHKQPCRPADHKTHSAEDAAITRSAVIDLNSQQKYQSSC